MKTMLACDYIESKVLFPVGMQAKIDGVRGLTPEGVLTARSMKKHKNKYTTAFYSKPEYAYFDGELAAERETHPDLCRITSSAVGTIKGEPFTQWHIFDRLDPNVVKAPYQDRHAMLVQYLDYEHRQGRCMNAVAVPMITIHNLEDMRLQHAKFMELGYEGSILRNLHGRHKEGRSTVLEGLLLRIKDFIEFEFRITDINEGEINENEAQVNELGRTFRSSHQENKIPNGMVGSFEGIVLEDVQDPSTGKTVLFKGQEVTVGPGKMDHKMRKQVWENNAAYLNQIGKGKFFPKGIKDKPRFPTFVSLRSAEDL